MKIGDIIKNSSSISVYRHPNPRSSFLPLCLDMRATVSLMERSCEPSISGKIRQKDWKSEQP